MLSNDSDRERSRPDARSGAHARPAPAGGQQFSSLKLPLVFLGRRKTVAICLLLFVLVLWGFLPSLRNDFVNYDDNVYVTENLQVQAGLTWESLAWAFGKFHGEQTYWHPLTWVSHMLDCRLYGLQPWGHHLTSVLWHAVNTLLVFLVFKRLTGAVWRCAVLAALFALHPLQVDTVAWVTERKNLLSTFFFLLTVWAYALYAELRSLKSKVQSLKSEVGSHVPQTTDHGPRTTDHGPRTTDHRSLITDHRSLLYLLSLFFFVCGLMSKATLLTLPFILLLLDWWPLRRFQVSTLRHLLFEKLPFLAAAAPAALVSVYGQKQMGALPGFVQCSLGERIANAILSFVRYVAQTFWPVDLAVYYPFPATIPLGPVVAAALLSLTASALLLWAARRRPYLAIGWLWFVVTLLPVIGLVQIGGHSRADRYTYVPLIGLFLLVVWAAHDFTKRWRYQAVCLAAAAVLVFSVCLVLTRRQIGYWKDSETLLRHALAVTGDNSVAQNNLGVALIKRGQPDEAVTHLQEATRIAPNFADAYNNLGTALAMQGRLDDAIARFQESLRLQPDYAQAHNDLGAALGRQGRLDEAIAHLQEAVRLAPDLADARCNLGDALAAKGRLDEAIAQYQQAIRLNPNYPDTHNHLGIALSSKGRLDEAIGHFQQALRLNPDYAEAQGNLGAAFGRMGRLDEAIYHLQEAVRLKPDYPAAQKNLRTALAAKAASPKQSGSSPAP